MKKYLFLLGILFGLERTLAQNCHNIGFDQGTLTNWVLSSGTLTDNGYQTVYGTEVKTIPSDEIQITTAADGNDLRIINENLPKLAPNSAYSIRFGNIGKGGRYERIKNTFLVTPNNTLLQYRFAVLLQEDNRGHLDFQKPGFDVRLYDSNGNNVTCSYYDIQLQYGNQQVDGFKLQGDIQYRNWTTVAVDLRSYVGQSLTLEATVHGCTRSAHFGYAYFDAKCLKTEIKPDVGCPDGNGMITLNAPEGFDKYTWSNGETNRSIKVKAVLGNQYSVKVVPYNSLNENCSIQIDYTIDKFALERELFKEICEGETYTFRGSSYKTTGTYYQQFSNPATCDSLITINVTVNPITRITQNVNLCEGEKFDYRGITYSTTGTYKRTFSTPFNCDSIVTLNVKVTNIDRTNRSLRICAGEKTKVGDSTYSKSGTYIYTFKRPAKCDSIVTTQLVVENAFAVEVSPDVSIEKGDSVLLKATVSPTGNYLYDWTPKDGLSCATCATTWAKPNDSHIYTITATLLNSTCNNKARTTVGVACGLYLPNVFTPNGDRINDIFKIEGSLCIKTIKEIAIYNRWGEMIYRDENFSPFDSSHGWDGTYRGVLALPEVYVYKVVAELKNGEIYNTSGAVTLLR